MTSQPKSLFLIGTSHIGKSTCAHRIGGATGWPVISTDMLGRHPGRPWTGVPGAIMEYYLRLSNDTIHWFLRVHHENMRPVIREKIRTVRQAGESFIFEGAALRPEYVADWEIGDALVVCFQVEDRILRERIMTESRYSEQDEQTKAAIEKFAERSLRENQAFAEASQRQGISLIDVTTPENADRATEELVLRLAGSSGPLSPSSRHPRHRWIGSAPGVRNAWPTWAASTSINDDDIPIIGRVEFR